MPQWAHTVPSKVYYSVSKLKFCAKVQDNSSALIYRHTYIRTQARVITPSVCKHSTLAVLKRRLVQRFHISIKPLPHMCQLLNVLTQSPFVCVHVIGPLCTDKGCVQVRAVPVCVVLTANVESQHPILFSTSMQVCFVRFQVIHTQDTAVVVIIDLHRWTNVSRATTNQPPLYRNTPLKQYTHSLSVQKYMCITIDHVPVSIGPTYAHINQYVVFDGLDH